jgi:Rps23 Pro-64 3,4-dihydroxylase Tpa1-like proline 4-hydroxylase
MLNPRLDLPTLHAEFAHDGRIRIRDVLDPAVANVIADEMACLPWKVFCATGAGVAVIDPAEMAIWDRARQAELQRSLLQAASHAITGSNSFDAAFAQATNYRPGHYLTRHLDDPKGEHRKFAFVWGYTRRWDPDWGGLLQFFDDQSRPAQAVSPEFNTLDLFDVHHIHSVTLVAPYALNPRLAVSGWYVCGDPLKPMGYMHTKAG